MHTELVRETEILTWCYEADAEQCNHPDLGSFPTYGLRVTGPEGYEEVIHDVSSNWTVVNRLADLFTRHQLSPLHFRDAVLDMLP